MTSPQEGSCCTKHEKDMMKAAESNDGMGGKGKGHDVMKSKILMLGGKCKESLPKHDRRTE